MRIRLSQWPALVAALVVVGTIGAVRVPLTDVHAASPSGPVNVPACEKGFCQVALQGFGDRANSWAWSMAYYNGHLLVGDNRNFQCSTQAMLNLTAHGLGGIIWKYPPPDPDMLCPTPIPALPPTLGGEIWSVDPSISASRPITNSDWNMVFQSPITVPMTVDHAQVMGPRDAGWRMMSIFDDGALYVSGVGMKPLGGNSVPPASLLRTTDGVHFAAVPADPGTTMGDLNTLNTIPGITGQSDGGCCIRGQVSFNGNLMILVGNIQGAGAVFASSTPQEGNDTFHQITPPDMKVYEMAVFNGYLYVGLQNKSTGYQLLRTQCTAPPQGQQYCSFDPVPIPAGGGLGSAGNPGVISMHVYTDTNQVPHLYIGTNGVPNATAAELVRLNPDDTWDLIVGKKRTVNGQVITPLSGLTSGFGWPFNWHMYRMETHNGVLFVSTFDGSTSMKDTAIGPLLKPFEGFDLYASRDGIHFTAVTRTGFGDPFSDAGRTLQDTPYGLFVGSENSWYGLRLWQGAVGQSALQSMPQNLQSDSGAGRGTIALAWDASAGAARYHVYRSSATLATAVEPANPDPEYVAPQSVNPRPYKVWVPGAFTEIGTTTAPYYVDRSVGLGGHYQYYVVAEDGSGALSLPSNTVANPDEGALPTFSSVYLAISAWAKTGRLAPQVAKAQLAGLTAAFMRMRAGDAQGGQTLLEAQAQQVLTTNQPTAARPVAESLAYLLNRLAARVSLVGFHVLPATHVQ